MTLSDQERAHHGHERRVPDDLSGRPGFAGTAAYFEKLAQRTREFEQRERLLEVAEFYHSLAQIAPRMPTGFSHKSGVVPLTRAERWKARADECRALADGFADPSCREQMARLAQTYDRLALAAE
jgi:hypothetical protein